MGYSDSGSLTLLDLFIQLGRCVRGPGTRCESEFASGREKKEILFLVRAEEEESGVYCFCFVEFTWRHLNAPLYYFVLACASCPPKNSVVVDVTLLFAASGKQKAAFALLRDLLRSDLTSVEGLFLPCVTRPLSGSSRFHY